MAVQGIIPPKFTPRNHDIGVLAQTWKDFRNELDIYFLASGQNNVEDQRKIALLLYQMGRQFTKVFENELVLTNDERKNYQTVCDKFTAYFEPKKLTRSYVSKFQRRVQSANESVSDFITALREIAKLCDFGDKEDDLMCVQISNGVRDETLKKKLWDESLTLKQIIEKCQTHEMREEMFSPSHSSTSTTNVNVVRRGRSRGRGQRYFQHYEQPQNRRGRGRGPQRDQHRGPHRGSQHGPPRGGSRGANQSAPMRGACGKCGRSHPPRQCPAYGKRCNKCGITGHFASMCFKSVHAVSLEDQDDFKMCDSFENYDYSRDFDYDQYVNHNYESHESDSSNMNRYLDEFSNLNIFAVGKSGQGGRSSSKEWDVLLKTPYLNGTGAVCMKIDTQAECNVISEKTFNNLQKHAKIKLEKTSSQITAFGNSIVKPMGKVSFFVLHNDVQYSIACEVVPGNVQNLLGSKDSLRLGLIKRINAYDKVQTDENKSENITSRIPEVEKVPKCIIEVLQKFPDRFPLDSIGKLPGECHLSIDPEYKEGPVSFGSRPLPAAMRDLTKKQLDYLLANDIIAKVPPNVPTPWCSQMHVVHKQDGKNVRVCIDPKFLNKALLRETHPIKTIEDVATKVGGSNYFTKLDANMGFFQIQLDYESQLLTTFGTPWGRYRYKRLPMGITSAPEIYQRKIEEIFEGIENLDNIYDDVLLYTESIEKQCRVLQQTLEVARENNLTFRLSKCRFAQPEVDYTGFILSGKGIKVQPEKVKAIVDMPQPETIEEVRTFLGMATYLSKHIENFSDITKDLRDLVKTKENKPFFFGKPQVEAFEQIKQALVSSPVLRYYSLKEPITVSCDASKHGLGATLLQNNDPVAYASKSLTQTEQAYAQIEKELLAIVFATKKYHHLLYGRSDITIETDHLPLLSIKEKPLGQVPMRIQKMLLKLQPYDFKLVHKSSKEVPVADCLSRLPLKDCYYPGFVDDIKHFNVCATEITSVSAFSGPKLQLLKDNTKTDGELQNLSQMIIEGWPQERSQLPNNLKPYWDFRDELSVYDGIIFKGERVVIPKDMQSEVLNMIHYSHQGLVKSKQLARDVVFWKGMNMQIQDLISKCSTCQTFRNNQQKEPMMSTDLPNLPWEFASSDLFELDGLHYLVTTDHYSGYIEVNELMDLTTYSVIRSLKQVFSTHGIPQILYHDPGTQFTSGEFRDFEKDWAFESKSFSATYSQANGRAEKAVQIAKNLLKKAKTEGKDFRLALLDYNNTPRDHIVGSPAQRCMGRRTRTRLPISNKALKPKIVPPQLVTNRLEEYQKKNKKYYDKHAKPLEPMNPGDSIRYRTGNSWTPAELISGSANPRSYKLKTPAGRIIIRNRRHLLKTKENDAYSGAQHQHRMSLVEDNDKNNISENNDQNVPIEVNDQNILPGNQNNQQLSTHIPNNFSSNGISDTTSRVTRSGRVSRPPTYLKDYVR